MAVGAVFSVESPGSKVIHISFCYTLLNTVIGSKISRLAGSNSSKTKISSGSLASRGPQFASKFDWFSRLSVNAVGGL